MINVMGIIDFICDAERASGRCLFGSGGMAACASTVVTYALLLMTRFG